MLIATDCTDHSLGTFVPYHGLRGCVTVTPDELLEPESRGRRNAQ